MKPQIKRPRKKLRDFLFRNYLDKDNEERIVDVIHKHVILFKYSAGKTFLLGILAPGLLYLLFTFRPIMIISVVWGMVGLIGIFYHFVDWYFDVWLITDQGIIAVKRNGFFDVSTQRIDYHLIEDISYSVTGFTRTLLNYGDITIDRMSANTSVILCDAANPKKWARKIAAYRDQFVAEKSVRDHEQLKGMLAEMIAYHSNSGRIKLGKD